MAKTPDFKLALKKSADFYRRAGLNSWLKALPKRVQIPEQYLPLLKTAAALGLDHAMVFPDFKTQMKSMSRVIKETVIKPVPGIPEHMEYAGPYVSHNWSQTPSGKVHQVEESVAERIGGPYLLLHNILNVPAETKGKTALQISKSFDDQQHNGITTPEFLVCLRRWREKLVEDKKIIKGMDFKDYRWVWLLDSMDKRNCAVAYFGPQVVGLYACKSSSTNRHRGANKTVVIPLH